MMQHSIGTFSHITPAMVHRKNDHATQDEIKSALSIKFHVFLALE